MTTNNQCHVCMHAQRAEIEAAIVRGVSQRTIALQFGLGSWQPVETHKTNHLSKELQQALIESKSRAQDILDQLIHQNERMYVMMNTAESDGDLRTALMANREYNRNLALFGQFTGDLKHQLELTRAPETDDVLRRLLPEAFEGGLPVVTVEETVIEPPVEIEEAPTSAPPPPQHRPVSPWARPFTPSPGGPLPGALDNLEEN